MRRRRKAAPGRSRRSKVVDEGSRRPTLIAAVISWQNGGRFEKDETAHGHLLKLYRDGTVISQMVFESRSGHRVYSPGRKAMNLSMMKAQTFDAEDFAREWGQMYEVKEYQRIGEAELKKLAKEAGSHGF